MNMDPKNEQKAIDGTESTEPAEIPESELESAAGGLNASGIRGLVSVVKHGGRVLDKVGTVVTVGSIVGSLWPQRKQQ